MYKWLKEKDVVSLPKALCRAIEEVPTRIALDFVLKVHPVSLFGGKFKFNLIIGKQMSYEALGELSRKFSELFDEVIENHDRSETIAIFTLNCPQFWGVYFGAHFSGAVPALISPATIIKELRAKKPVKDIQLTAEIRNQILDAKPKVIVVTDFLWPILRQMYDDLEGTAVILTRLSDTLPFYWRSAYERTARREGRWIEPEEGEEIAMFFNLMNAVSPKPWSEVIMPPKEGVAHLIYTGGTTGVPKGAMSSHANCMANVLQCREQLDKFINDGDSVFGTMPFFHSYGMIIALMALFSIRGTLIFPPAFEPKEVVYLLKKRQVQIFGGINRMFKALSVVPTLGRLPDLKLCISGAGKLDSNVKDEFEKKTGAKIVEGYGLTEATPVISVTAPDEDKPRTIGRPIPGTEVKLIDINTGKEVGEGEVGEIVVRGPQVMLGYYKKPEETDKVLTDGWLRTGDTAYRDREGFLYFVGREKEMSKINGENVFWLDVERHFLTSEAIDQKCAVVGVPRPGYDDEEQLVIFVVLKPGKIVTDLRELDRAAKAKNWLIKEIVPVDDNVFGEWEDAIGKVQKRKVKKYYEETSKEPK